METVTNTEPKKIKGPCCVCKETRSERDMCYITRRPEDCIDEISKHNLCLKSFGFNPDTK